MEFKTPYLLAMREQAPKMFQELVRSGKMDAHLQAKALEAKRMLQGLLAGAPKDEDGRPQMEAERAAEEVVRATLIEFPTPPDPDRLEPPDDLPAPRAKIIKFNPAR